ncbi:sigma factor G inhibitor Gin [Clostridium aestuarii]|uniref:Sigma factor G inhibitor Gin n=1 Tax=Clostridium aestuarii TaxID=338193 RepID=A0ABT4D2B4_9CLOT|nr:sigma factor G inhibitor Gin [Clostridium aestuarii]MCY6484777.1 sigma factor G inhibitor Gin [Clostridium aestuarii]
MQKRKCIICRKPLNDGIMINGRGICKNCEERIINSENGTDFYEYYINCIKKTIVHYMIRGVDYKCQNYPL